MHGAPRAVRARADGDAAPEGRHGFPGGGVLGPRRSAAAQRGRPGGAALGRQQHHNGPAHHGLDVERLRPLFAELRSRRDAIADLICEENGKPRVEAVGHEVTTFLTARLGEMAVISFLALSMIAAAMSSLDSVLLVMASTFHRDIISINKGERSESLQIKSTRKYVVICAVITAIIALNPPGGIVSLTSFSGSLYAACFLPAILLGLHWKKGNNFAVLSSMISGALVLILWPLTPYNGLIHKVFPAIILSTILYIAFTLQKADTSDKRVPKLFSN